MYLFLVVVIVMSFTKCIPVTCENNDMESIIFQGGKIFITYSGGRHSEYNYEFVRCSYVDE